MPMTVAAAAPQELVTMFSRTFLRSPHRVGAASGVRGGACERPETIVNTLISMK